jgi:hypothetical protein
MQMMAIIDGQLWMQKIHHPSTLSTNLNGYGMNEQ